MPRSRINSEQADDNDFAFQLELDQVKDNNRDPALFDPILMNNYDLYKKNQQSGYASLGQIVFGGQYLPYFRNNARTWETAGRFFFPGTDVIGIPVGFKIVAEMRSGTGVCRLYDVSNNTTISEMNVTSGNWDTVTDLNLLNLPNDESIFEIQIREHPTLSGNQIRISCSQLLF